MFIVLLAFVADSGVSSATPLAECFNASISEKEVREGVERRKALDEAVRSLPGFRGLENPSDTVTTTTINAIAAEMLGSSEIAKTLPTFRTQPTEAELAKTRALLE